MVIRLAAIICLLLFATATQAQPPIGKDKTKHQARVAEEQACSLALADVSTLSPFQRLTTRYLWINSGDYQDAQAATFAINVISRSAVVWRLQPNIIGKDALMLLRLDLTALRRLNGTCGKSPKRGRN